MKYQFQLHKDMLLNPFHGLTHNSLYHTYQDANESHAANKSAERSTDATK